MKGLLKDKAKLQQLKRIALVCLGSFILGIGCGLFLVPYNIVSGGVTGIAIVLHTLFDWDVELATTIITWLFFIAGWLILGTKFAAKTVLSSIIYPLSMMLGTFLYENTMFNLGPYVEGVVGVNVLIAALFGGLFVGAGVGLTFIGGGSTGGVDVVALAVQKFTPIKTSIASFTVDAIIIVIGLICVNSFEATLIGIIAAFLTSLMIDKLFDSERNVVVNIISKKYAEINEIVISKLDRGSTIISGIGGYSKEEVTILQVVLNIREYYILQDIIAQIDSTAFVSVSKAYNVRGEGFQSHKIVNTKHKEKNEK